MSLKCSNLDTKYVNTFRTLQILFINNSCYIQNGHPKSIDVDQRNLLSGLRDDMNWQANVSISFRIMHFM
jgi:hypothetical protein